MHPRLERDRGRGGATRGRTAGNSETGALDTTRRHLGSIRPIGPSLRWRAEVRACRQLVVCRSSTCTGGAGSDIVRVTTSSGVDIALCTPPQ